MKGEEERVVSYSRSCRTTWNLQRNEATASYSPAGTEPGEEILSPLFLHVLLMGPSKLETNEQGSTWPQFTQAASLAQSRVEKGGGSMSRDKAREPSAGAERLIQMCKCMWINIFMRLCGFHCLCSSGFIMILLIPHGWYYPKQQWETDLLAQDVSGVRWGENCTQQHCHFLGFPLKSAVPLATGFLSFFFFFPPKGDRS